MDSKNYLREKPLFNLDFDFLTTFDPITPVRQGVSDSPPVLQGVNKKGLIINRLHIQPLEDRGRNR